MKHEHPEGRFIDLSNPPKPRWRDALQKLLAPASRIHRYRNFHSAAFYEAVDDLDCGSKS